MLVNCGSGWHICQSYRFEWLIDISYPAATLDHWPHVFRAAYIIKQTNTNGHIKIKTADVRAG